MSPFGLTWSGVRQRAIRARHLRGGLIIALGVAASACGAKHSDAYFPSGDAVPLTLKLVGDSVWEARFASGGASTAFRVRPRVKEPGDTAQFGIVRWTLYSVPGSKPSALLGALAKVHQVPDTLTAPPRADSLRVEVALLGVNVARLSEGGFTGDKGDWITAKLFLAGGEAEVYLNLNPHDGRAELAVKDEEYGPLVLRELARVLSG